MACFLFRLSYLYPFTSFGLGQIGHEVVKALSVPDKVHRLGIGGSVGIVERVGLDNERFFTHAVVKLLHSLHVLRRFLLGQCDGHFAVSRGLLHLGHVVVICAHFCCCGCCLAIVLLVGKGCS